MMQRVADIYSLEEYRERRREVQRIFTESAESGDDADAATRNAVARVHDAAVEYLDARRGSVDEHVLLEAAYAVLGFLSHHIAGELEENTIKLLHADIPPALLASGSRILVDAFEDFEQAHDLFAADIPAGTPRELQRILGEMMKQAREAQPTQNAEQTPHPMQAQQTMQSSLTIDDIADMPTELLSVLIRDTLEARISFDLDEDEKPVLVLGP